MTFTLLTPVYFHSSSEETRQPHVHRVLAGQDLHRRLQ